MYITVHVLFTISNGFIVINDSERICRAQIEQNTTAGIDNTFITPNYDVQQRLLAMDHIDINSEPKEVIYSVSLFQF